MMLARPHGPFAGCTDVLIFLLLQQSSQPCMTQHQGGVSILNKSVYRCHKCSLMNTLTEAASCPDLQHRKFSQPWSVKGLLKAAAPCCSQERLLQAVWVAQGIQILQRPWFRLNVASSCLDVKLKAKPKSTLKDRRIVCTLFKQMDGLAKSLFSIR